MSSATTPAKHEHLRGALVGSSGGLKEGLFGLGCGVLYGLTSPIIGHPLDTIKTKMQAQVGSTLPVVQPLVHRLPIARVHAGRHVSNDQEGHAERRVHGLVPWSDPSVTWLQCFPLSAIWRLRICLRTDEEQPISVRGDSVYKRPTSPSVDCWNVFGVLAVRD